MDANPRPMPGADRNDQGKYTDTYPDSDFLNALHGSGGRGTTDIADAVGCDRRTAYLRLNSLEDDGRVTSRKVGNTLIWHPMDGETDAE